jgi:uncharacterized low-complexity protein
MFRQQELRKMKTTLKTLKKPVALAIGAAMATTLAAANVAQAAPFVATDLAQGYAQFMGEGSCGGEKGKEGKCGEGKCGGEKKEGEKGKEGSCGGEKGKEGKCGGEKKPGT